MSPTTTLEYSSHAPEPLSYPRLANHNLTSSNTPDYLRLILTSKVYEILKETPLVLASNLSAKLGNQIWLKREDLQEVFSFKIRGAYNFMASLTDDERWKGVVTCSAGWPFLSFLSGVLIHPQATTRKASRFLGPDWAFLVQLSCLVARRPSRFAM